MGFEQYRVLIRYDKDEAEFVAEVPELTSFGELRADTRAELIAELDDALDAAAQQEIAEHGSLPTPVDDSSSGYDGVLELELGVSLHRELAHRALAEKTTVETLAANVISLYLGGRLLAAGRGREGREFRDGQREGRGRRKGGGASSYHEVMEDKASFMEYVRQQERAYGGGRGPRRRRGGRDED